MSKPNICVYAMCIGGAGDIVTASSTILDCQINGKSHFIAVDCGIAQGKDAVRYADFPITGKNIEAIIITHAHMDHFGGLAFLRDFKGKIYATSETFLLSEPIVYDVAEHNVRKAADMLGMSKVTYHHALSKLDEMSRRKKGPSDAELYKDLCDRYDDIEQAAIYTVNDVDDIRKHFCKINPFQVFVIAKGIYGRLIPNPHLLGAVSVEIYIGEITDENTVGISFSGDLGPKDNLLYRTMSYEANKYIKYAWIESIHGTENRLQTIEQGYELFKKCILRGYKNNSPVIIVVPSLDRSAKALFWINKFKREYEIDVPLYWDTPLGYDELIIYQRVYSLGKSFWFKDFDENPFIYRNLHVCQNITEHTMSLTKEGFKTVIVASPFNENGRVMDYYMKYIYDKNAQFVFISWLMPDSVAYSLVKANDGKDVNLLGDKYVKHCEVTQILCNSGHGNLPEYIDYINRFPNLKGLVINHGDRKAKNDVAKYYKSIYDFKIVIPEIYDDEGGENCFYRLDSSEITSISSQDGYKIFEPVF